MCLKIYNLAHLKIEDNSIIFHYIATFLKLTYLK